MTGGKFDDSVPRWSPKPAADPDIPLDARQNRTRDRIAAEQEKARQDLMAKTAAELGSMSNAAQNWVLGEMRRSADPAMHDLAQVLQGMFTAGRRRGRPSAEEKNSGLAFWMHVEVAGMRAAGEPEYDIRARAADIIIAERKNSNGGKRPLSRRRLLEIYRQHEPSLLKEDPKRLEAAAFLRNAARWK